MWEVLECLPGHSTGPLSFWEWKGANQGSSVEDRGGSMVTGANRTLRQQSLGNSWGAEKSPMGPSLGKDSWCRTKPLSSLVWVTSDSTLLILPQRHWWIWKPRPMFRSWNLSLESAPFLPQSQMEKAGDWSLVLYVSQRILLIIKGVLEPKVEILDPWITRKQPHAVLHKGTLKKNSAQCNVLKRALISTLILTFSYALLWRRWNCKFLFPPCFQKCLCISPKPLPFSMTEG